MLDIALPLAERRGLVLPAPVPSATRARALGLITPGLDAEVRRVLGELSLEAELTGDAVVFAARAAVYAPDLFIVDMDAPGVHAGLVSAARSLRRQAPVVALAYYWSEREGYGRALADALVHKPPRTAEWLGELRRLGLAARPAA